VRLLLLAAAFALPQSGVVDPGKRLGGLRLGATAAAVRAAWGGDFGRCRGCAFPTWYFTYRRYTPQGAAVELRGGRVSALFTLWSPPGWHTPAGLTIGDASSRIGELYGPLARRECRGYHAFVLTQRRVVTAFYVVDEKVWGFGLSRRSVPVCRR
jgi:hypothetical protein